MIAVIFEVTPSADGRAGYLARAAQLAPLLACVDGFISVERFTSITTPGKMLSLSFWRDEAAVQAWRQQEQHRVAQRAGRDGVFDDYRLRVASVIRDYGIHDRAQAPADQPPMTPRSGRASP
ncbi:MULTISPECIES: antibiotic biosynthesis monooxygenase [unclassified Duganella]|uniref:antibiotic biosynthesis monooxygenase family protein n=1 Tax=unclassified Duganella TaxID=2636909 RepID=UPI0008838D25|nr:MULTISPECIES: antibiotic biosynthesis monooxygenase [unclassified Duganella]SDF47821.1 Heme-degrading monooxygenase HmoA [Duganella sp. OV458]SDI79110.1 Heme-degrading monooxygenase HmoA [Duganella sp. OV510]